MTSSEGNIVLAPMRLQAVTHAQAHLLAARDFIAGLQAIQLSGRTPHRAISLLAGQAVESLLEGYILALRSEKEPPRDGGHDLEKLWATAVAKGLAVTSNPPTWLQILARGHRSPFAVRYQRVPGGQSKVFAHGSSYPSPVEIFEEVPKLLALVAPTIDAHQFKHG